MASHTPASATRTPLLHWPPPAPNRAPPRVTRCASGCGRRGGYQGGEQRSVQLQTPKPSFEAMTQALLQLQHWEDRVSRSGPSASNGARPGSPVPPFSPTIEQQLQAKTCRCCAKPVRPYQAKGLRETDFDLCSSCWRKTPAGRAHKNSIRKSQSRYGDLRSHCQTCVHWLISGERGRCTLDLPDRQPDCSYYVKG